MTKRRHAPSAGVSPREFRLALAQLPRRVREAARLAHDISGITAVASFAATAPDRDDAPAIPPPLHPRCEFRHRSAGEEPCAREWERHIRHGRRSRAVHCHVCPAGLLCACVPIYWRETLVGVAKCVGDPDNGSEGFLRAVKTLELAIAKACQDLRVAEQALELDAMRRRLEGLRGAAGVDAPAHVEAPAPAGGRAAPQTGRSTMLVERALDYIARHYLSGSTTLKRISRELGVTEKHLTRCFTAVAGQRMHTYLLELRIQHASREVVATEKPLKQIAFESGFNRDDTFRRAFRRIVGVAPGAYRAAFAGH